MLALFGGTTGKFRWDAVSVGGVGGVGFGGM